MLWLYLILRAIWTRSESLILIYIFRSLFLFVYWSHLVCSGLLAGVGVHFEPKSTTCEASNRHFLQALYMDILGSG